MSDENDSKSDDTASNLKGAIPENVQGTLLQALTDKVGDMPECEICGSNHWSIDPRLVSPLMVTLTDEGRVTGMNLNKVAPCMWLSCTNCGNSKFLKASLFDPLREVLGEPNG